MTQRYCAAVVLTDDGEPFPSISVFDNQAVTVFYVAMQSAPKYIHERLALLKMTDNATGESSIGNRVNTNYIHVYLTRSEFNHLKKSQTK